MTNQKRQQWNLVQLTDKFIKPGEFYSSPLVQGSCQHWLLTYPSQHQLLARKVKKSSQTRQHYVKTSLLLSICLILLSPSFFCFSFSCPFLDFLRDLLSTSKLLEEEPVELFASYCLHFISVRFWREAAPLFIFSHHFNVLRRVFPYETKSWYPWSLLRMELGKKGSSREQANCCPPLWALGLAGQSLM